MTRNLNTNPTAPANAQNRIAGEDLVVVIGTCTRRKCVTVFDLGEHNGWFCPCCGSHYDPIGRIRKGIAPENMAIPRFQLTSKDKLFLPNNQTGTDPGFLYRVLYGA